MKDILIDLNIDKSPYIKQLTNDNVINITGQSGSGKSTYAKENFNNDNYIIIDTDEIFNEIKYKTATVINKELGKMFREKYSKLPDLGDDFDLIYQDILNYCKGINKIIVIDCAMLHCIKNLSLLKGSVIIMRTSINTCYKRCIDRYKKMKPNATEEEINRYSEKKKKIFEWYKYSNEFIKKIDKLIV